jgi:DHA2 family multidrug resistance protein
MRRNFGLATLTNFLLGTALYGSTFILPLYLSQMQGQNAEQIGMVLAWTGIPQLVIIPLVPMLMKRIDARVLTGIGFALFAASNFMNTTLNVDVSGDQLFWPNLVRALGQAVILTPLAAIATAGIEPANAGSASGLFNMTRNLGGAIGIAVLETFLTRREQFHSSVITSRVTLFDEATRQRIAELQSYFLSHGIADPAQAWHQAVVAVGRTVRAQANFIAYGDAFMLLGMALSLALFAVFFLRRPGSLGAGAVD